MSGCSLRRGLRWLATLCSLLLLICASRPARAWIEKTIESSAITVEVDNSGLARVSFALSLKVRGARLRGLTLYGADPDAIPLADGTITRIKDGRATSLPLPLNVIASGGKLEISLPLNKGFRGRQFRLEFGYRTRLLERGLIWAADDPQRAELAWTGPRYPNGVDAARVVVRVPSSTLPPRLGPIDEETGFGMVLNTLRRTASHDELELVRSHLAEGEAMTWQVQVDRDLFSATAAEFNAPKQDELKHSRPTGPSSTTPNPLRRNLGLAGLSGFAFALLLAVKIWSLRSGTRQGAPLARGLLPLSAPLRTLGAGLFFAAAAGFILSNAHPAVAAANLLLAMAFAMHRSPTQPETLRGAGHWHPIVLEKLAPAHSVATSSGWLDCSRPAGLTVMLLLLGATATVAHRLFNTSPYLGASTLCSAAAFLPIFCTGTSKDAPLERVTAGKKLLGKLQNILTKSPEVLVSPLGRYANGDGGLDEIRLSVVPQQGLAGLIGMEVAVEVHSGWGGSQALPVVLLRAADRSPCHRALPRELSWSRGRSSLERVTMVRPQWPTAEGTAQLVVDLLYQLRKKQSRQPSKRPMAELQPQRSKKATSSFGKELPTSKAGTPPPPLHAT